MARSDNSRWTRARCVKTGSSERRSLDASEHARNPEHPRGKHKARVFATLGFTAENADALRAALLMAAASGDAQPAASDQFGDRYVLEFEIEGPRAKGIVRSMWIVGRGERAPRLTSCFVK